MLDSLNLKQVLFLDIETVPQKPAFNELPEEFKKLWDKKSSFFRKDEQEAADVYERAGIYAEFGKIICISVGAVTGERDNYGFKLKSFYGDDEVKLLSEFYEMVEKLNHTKQLRFCAHNGKEFDYPYLSRRMLINKVKLPDILDIAGKKPWEVNHLDTLELWKFGDYKHYTSLDLLTHVFDIPSPKQDIDGSMVARVFYEEKDLEKIKVYCEHDVVAVAQLLMRYMGLPLIESIIYS
ncbi:MAG: 3'-5' exonuclease [Bacteroidales bacterium]|nr:3'-5' exonuclease [Bacteroidales bacterium]MBN2819395.1 3'-5' exonuclease [Bacteroidales bacterium]